MMDYQIRVERHPAQTTAVVRCLARQSALSEVVPRCCGEVWTFLRAAGFPKPGRNLALYLDGAINLECGVVVTHAFTGNERVVCSSTPSGLVATATHWGPYSRLGEAHRAICDWCAAHGHTLAGPSWELYGHWHDDPAQLRTDVYYLLQPGSQGAGTGMNG
jgi:effector-binding domain-containing protein